MPKESTHTGIAQGPGKDSKRRTAGQRSVCGQRAGQASASAGDRHTLSSIKFTPKPGTEVFFKREGIPEEGGAEKLYDDLFRAYRNAHNLITGDQITVNPATYLPLSHALDYILDSFKKLLPRGFDFNIELEDGGGDYYFVIYKPCECGYGWSFFPIGKALKKLSIENPTLHDLFVVFIHTLFRIGGIEVITSGFMYNTLENLKESIEYRKEDYDVENLVDIAKDIHTYTKGEAHRYEILINQSAETDPEEIMRHVRRFKKGAPIANLIYQGCRLLIGRNSLYDFTYMPFPPDEGYDCGLPLDAQYTVIWDEEDALKADHDENLDAYSQEGVQEPVVFLKIKATTKEIDLERLQRKMSWPQQLADFFARAYDLIHKYTDNE